MRKNLIAIAVLLETAACNSPTGVNRLEAVPSLSRSNAAPVHQVTGGGQLVGSDWTETYGLNARMDGDGNVQGQVEMFLSGLPGVHGSVTCLAVDGSFAWIGGVVTVSLDETQIPVGTPFWFRVQDNGQGPDNPDRISSIRLGLAASICNEKRPAAVPWLLLRGNIVVR